MNQRGRRQGHHLAVNAREAGRQAGPRSRRLRRGFVVDAALLGQVGTGKVEVEFRRVTGTGPFFDGREIVPDGLKIGRRQRASLFGGQPIDPEGRQLPRRFTHGFAVPCLRFFNRGFADVAVGHALRGKSDAALDADVPLAVSGTGIHRPLLHQAPGSPFIGGLVENAGFLPRNFQACPRRGHARVLLKQRARCRGRQKSCGIRGLLREDRTGCSDEDGQ